MTDAACPLRQAAGWRGELEAMRGDPRARAVRVAVRRARSLRRQAERLQLEIEALMALRANNKPPLGDA